MESEATEIKSLLSQTTESHNSFLQTVRQRLDDLEGSENETARKVAEITNEMDNIRNALAKCKAEHHESQEEWKIKWNFELTELKSSQAKIRK